MRIENMNYLTNEPIKFLSAIFIKNTFKLIRIK